MFFASSAAPSFLASNWETCLYSVPTCARSSSSSTGAEMAPGIWSASNSAGERQSMMVSKEEKSICSMRKFYAYERARSPVAKDPTYRVQPWRRLRLQDGAGCALGNPRRERIEGRAAEGSAGRHRDGGRRGGL